MRRAAAALFVLLAASPAHAQPYSASMADCAALYQNGAQWVRSDENSARFMRAANAWADAAIARARAEGVRNPRTAMWTRIDAKTGEWERKGAAAFMSQDFRDWAAYCRKFAKARGIKVE